jgi:CHAT domain-containing protein
MTSGALTALPIGILPLESGRLLQDERSIVYLPSLVLLRESDERPVRGGTLFALGDPAYDREATIDQTVGRELLAAMRGSDKLGMFVALPETRDEVEAIGRHFPDRATILVGSEASESTTKGRDLVGYDYLHLATHGVLGG